MSEETVKYLLPESEIPTHWVNLLPDLPGDPMPPLNPQTMQPAGPDDLTPIFPMGVIQQEVSMDPEVEIPDEVRAIPHVYKLMVRDAQLTRSGVTGIDHKVLTALNEAHATPQEEHLSVVL